MLLQAHTGQDGGLAVRQRRGQAAAKVGVRQRRQQVQDEVVVHQVVAVRLRYGSGTAAVQQLQQMGGTGLPWRQAAAGPAGQVGGPGRLGGWGSIRLAAAHTQHAVHTHIRNAQAPSQAHLQALEVVRRQPRAVWLAHHHAARHRRAALRLAPAQLGVQHGQHQGGRKVAEGTWGKRGRQAGRQAGRGRRGHKGASRQPQRRRQALGMHASRQAVPSPPPVPTLPPSHPHHPALPPQAAPAHLPAAS